MANIKKFCNICNKSFKKMGDLEDHLDYHTPYWSGKKITLSGPDQIRLMLKDMVGSWKVFIKQQEELYKQYKNQLDYVKALQIQKFEKDNRIKFKVCGDDISFIKERSKI